MEMQKQAEMVEQVEMAEKQAEIVETSRNGGHEQNC